jgi:AmmeMemoRadiSam system protein A
MARQFTFLLSDEEKTFLKNTVRESIRTHLAGESAEAPAPLTDKLAQPLGAFVTLTLGGRLRGCIGNLQSEAPLASTIWNMARSAAFKDPRFPPLTEQEFADVEIEISILSTITECHDVNAVEVGRHGLIVQRAGKSGLLLPQVAVQWGWDRETFLAQTCRKAGLDPSVIHKAGTAIFWFEASVF